MLRRLFFLLLTVASVSAPAFAQSPIASVTLTSGWATFGQAVPPGVALGLEIPGVATQTDVKSRWPDGTIKFAVVTARITTAGTYSLVPATAATGTFAPSLPTVTASFTIGGVAHTATLPSAPSSDVWLSGPLVYEGRSTVAPASGGTPHPFLRVNFDTRVYSDGTGRLDVSVENVLNQTGATTITYDVAIALNGIQVFSRTALKHFYLTRWRKTFPINGATFATITPDIRPFNTSRILPPYLSLVSNVVSTPTGAAFDLLGPGALNADMPAHGGRSELAPYPDWTARYLVHRNATQRSYVLANGDLSGSWPVHVREAETSTKQGVGTERLVSLDQRPTFWYDARAQGAGNDFVRGTPMPIREYSGATPTALQTALTPDNAHQPSIAYVPYLLTGDRYYAEEMAFWANYGMLRTYPGDNVRGAAGILESNETRGYGWALRNLAEAAALYPDSSPVKTYLSQKVANNLQWLDNYANAQPASNPFKILWIGMRPDGTQYISMWEQNYLAYAIDRAGKLGFSGGLAHRDAIARFQVRLLTSDPEYPKAEGAPYVVAVGPAPASLGWDDYPTYPFYTTMAQIWGGTQGQERPFAGYYGPEARLNVMMGVEAAWPGAQSAYDYLWPFIGVTPTWGALPDLAQRAGWALDFYPTTVPAVAPAVTLNPLSLAVVPGRTVTFRAAASGTPGPVVQWQQSTGGQAWTNIAGANSTQYSFAATLAANGTRYRAVFSNAGGSMASTAATLYVRAKVKTSPDLDGDGLTDLTVWRASTGTWYSLTSSSGNNPQQARGVQWGSSAMQDIPMTGDLDGDSMSDLIVWRPVDGTWYWLLSSRGYAYANQGQRQWGNVKLGDAPFLGDVDGDGKDDLIVWRASTGTWYWLTSSTGYSYAAANGIQWGNNGLGDQPLVADWDGDGRIDLGVWRATSGTWYWLTSSSGYSYASARGIQWGVSSLGDKPMASDMDGDGKADLVVWRASNATWYWLTSASGYAYASARGQQFGDNALGDMPSVLDMDGDGKGDLVVWRPSNGTWSWLCSSTGYDPEAAQTQAWGQGSLGDVPIRR